MFSHKSALASMQHGRVPRLAAAACVALQRLPRLPGNYLDGQPPRSLSQGPKAERTSTSNPCTESIA